MIAAWDTRNWKEPLFVKTNKYAAVNKIFVCSDPRSFISIGATNDFCVRAWNTADADGADNAPYLLTEDAFRTIAINSHGEDVIVVTKCPEIEIYRDPSFTSTSSSHHSSSPTTAHHISY